MYIRVLRPIVADHARSAHAVIVEVQHVVAFLHLQYEGVVHNVLGLCHTSRISHSFAYAHAVVVIFIAVQCISAG